MTIREIAQMAGVSTAAVSRYLNSGSLSEEKRRAIRAVIEQTGYKPDTAAQTLRTGRVHQIGLIVPRINSESVSQVTAGVTAELAQSGYLPILGNTNSHPERELDYLSALQENRVAGIILMGTEFTPAHAGAFAACTVPLVITGQSYPGLPCVFHDDRNAARELTQRMLARGRRCIGYIGVSDRDRAAGLNRRLGVEEALQEAGLDPRAMPQMCGPFDEQTGFSCMTELLAQAPALDGVMCATDMIALGAMRALKTMGRAVPQEISVAGIGDSWAGTITDPQLTTARLYQRQCGTEAARLLLQLICGEDPAEGQARQLMLGYTIMERGSI